MKTYLPARPPGLRLWLFILSAALPACLLAQKGANANLVQNPSFEDLTAGATLMNRNDISTAAGWSAPNSEESLLYTTEGQYVFDPNGSSWPFKARTGRNVAGMNVYGGTVGNEHREYIQGHLTQPLTVGKRYVFEFWVHYHCEGANNIGIAFLPRKMSATTGGLLALKPVSHQRDVTPYNNDKNTWTLVRDSFTAAEPYQSFVIGNFFPDADTKVESARYRHYLAYIDDIVVVEAADQKGVTPITQEEKAKWITNSQIAKAAPEALADVAPLPAVAVAAAADRVQFELASARLAGGEQPTLDALVAQMKNDPKSRLVIRGFASSEGAASANKQLSLRRARAVRDYLVDKGAPKKRIRLEAFGEGSPIGNNATEAGREQNRRVDWQWEGQ